MEILDKVKLFWDDFSDVVLASLFVMIPVVLSGEFTKWSNKGNSMSKSYTTVFGSEPEQSELIMSWEILEFKHFKQGEFADKPELEQKQPTNDKPVSVALVGSAFIGIQVFYYKDDR